MLKKLQKIFWRTVMTRNFSAKLHLERTNIDICVAVAVVATTEEGGGTCGCGTTAVLVVTKCCKSTTTSSAPCTTTPPPPVPATAKPPKEVAWITLLISGCSVLTTCSTTKLVVPWPWISLLSLPELGCCCCCGVWGVETCCWNSGLGESAEFGLYLQSTLSDSK